MMSTWPTVSVVTPARNAERALPRLLTSLAKQTYPRELVQIIVVDNDSTDGTWDVIRAHPDVLGLRETRYHTPGAARNAGLRAARGEVIAMIDADCWADADWLRNGVRYLLEWGFDRVAGQVRFLASLRPNIHEVFDSAVNFQQREFVAQRWSGTGNLFLRRTLLEEVGLLDPTLKSAEDYEFGLRATAAGKSLGYCADAVVYHHTRKCFVALFRKFLRTGYGCGQVFRKYGYFATSAFFRKANYRPLFGTWRDFPQGDALSPRMRWQVDLLWNAMRVASNLGNFAGYCDLLAVGRERRT